MADDSPVAIPAFEPVALTIAGSDSGGGAGIQADLRAFRFFRVFGTTAITAVTAQNPRAVLAVQPLSALTVEQQIDAVFAAFRVGAVKTGMLFSAEIIEAVARALALRRDIPLVVDPVMVATSGARLLRDDAVQALRERLLPRALLVTPNLPEAEVLLGRRLTGRAAVRTAVVEMARALGCRVLVKGGHDTAFPAVDTLSDGRDCWEFSSPVAAAPCTHGTGCTLSAGIAACLARGASLLEAVRQAKALVLASLSACVPVGEQVWALGEPTALHSDAVRCERL